MIKFTDFLRAPNPKRTKVKFNMNPGDSSIRSWDLLLEDDPRWYDMNAHKAVHANNNLNQADYLFSFAQYYPYGPEYFIFGGLYEVKSIQPEVFDQVGYELTLMDEYKEFRKRLIVKLAEPIGRNLYNRNYLNLQKSSLNPEIYELAPNTKLGHFPGYQQVSMTHQELQQIVNNEEPSWKQALSHVKGVYVITDTSTGELYIGSASGNNDGIWQRWSSYSDLVNPTGGNKEFRNIVAEYSSDYIVNHFKYSILEIFDTKTKVETIIERENYWKQVFETKKYGMNHN